MKNMKFDDIEEYLNKDIKPFKEASAKYYLYK
ncbi:MAG: hypothetical protein LWX56_14755 [Ignavibacteria bacterium]|nr:hypothetical protein [Ignavibacteria bacterium]